MRARNRERRVRAESESESESGVRERSAPIALFPRSRSVSRSRPVSRSRSVSRSHSPLCILALLFKICLGNPFIQLCFIDLHHQFLASYR